MSSAFVGLVGLVLAGLTVLSYFIGSIPFALMLTCTLTILGVELVSHEARQWIWLVSCKRLTTLVLVLVGATCLGSVLASYSPRGGWEPQTFLRLTLPVVVLLLVLWASSAQSMGLILVAGSFVSLEFFHLAEIWINNQSFLRNWGVVSFLRTTSFGLAVGFVSLLLAGLALFWRESHHSDTWSRRSIWSRSALWRTGLLVMILGASFFGAAYSISLKSRTLSDWESRLVFDISVSTLRALDSQARNQGARTGFSTKTRRVDFYLVLEPRDCGIRLSVYSTSWFGLRRRAVTLRLDNLRVESELRTPIFARGIGHQVDFVVDSLSYLEEADEGLVIHLQTQLD